MFIVVLIYAENVQYTAANIREFENKMLYYTLEWNFGWVLLFVCVDVVLFDCGQCGVLDLKSKQATKIRK